MKSAGNKTTKKASPKVSAAEPKKINKRSKNLGGVYGDSGTEIYQGFISEEYNNKLADVEGIKVFDKMRKQDGTVSSAVLVTSLPIRQANWFIKPVSEDPQNIEIADFVSWALFDAVSISWQDLLRQSLLSTVFGVMVFEKVFSVKERDGVEYVCWDDLAPRMPKTINSWETSDGHKGIQQQLRTGKVVDIPMEKLLVFVNDMEGENWWGTSILRAAYKHWYFKDNFYKVDAIAFERQGLGIPRSKLKEGANDNDYSKAESILKNMRANHKGFLVTPHDVDIEFMDMKAQTTRDPMPSILHHDRQIVKSVLAQFLDLGAGETGSRALSTDQSEMFLTSLQAVANNIAGTFNKHAIEQLVDLNFDGVTEYPKLAYTGIERKDQKNIAETYKILAEAGGIRVTDSDEQHFREMMGLPENEDEHSEGAEADTSTDNDDESIPVDEEAEKTIDELGLSDFLTGLKKKITTEGVHTTIASKVAEFADIQTKISYLRAVIANGYANQSGNQEFSQLLISEANRELAIARKQAFAEQDPYKSFRKLTFAEQKVDFKALEAALDTLEDQFDKETQAILNKEKEVFMKKLSRAVNAGNAEAVKTASFEAKAKYARVIKSKIKEAYERGKKNAALEMGVKTPATPKAVLDQIDILSDAIAESHIGQLTTQAKTRLTTALAKGESKSVALAAADVAVAKKIIEITRNASRIAMAGYINNGRNTVFEVNSEKIYALQRSEVLDNRTCNYCLSVDGRVISKTDSFGRNTIFHSGCRGIWVEILLDEQELPPIGGIPATVRDRFGDAVNDLIQPKTPVTKKDSLARKEEEKRAKRKAERNKQGDK